MGAVPGGYAVDMVLINPSSPSFENLITIRHVIWIPGPWLPLPGFPISHFLRPRQTMAAPAIFLGYIDENADRFIKRLADAVAIPR